MVELRDQIQVRLPENVVLLFTLNHLTSATARLRVKPSIGPQHTGAHFRQSISEMHIAWKDDGTYCSLRLQKIVTRVLSNSGRSLCLYAHC
jgi:hypothetical protein